MSQEILYTSAPRLLKPGLSGYGTVISTRGIGPHLADKLESLSGYRWAFDQGDPKARQNPDCYTHLIVTVGGQKFHVLSRVADYGADYSGRSNKIAHHVALAESELTQGGPAWVLKSEGFCETAWDGELRVVETGRMATRQVREVANYGTWRRLTGDAGWAGVLAETVDGPDRRAVHIIFPLGTDTLSLAEEAMNLLPHRQRWNVTFSTYYTVLPAGTECQWRFVLDGTPEATNLRRQPHQRIIDLCSPLGPPSGGELVNRAREGWQPSLRGGEPNPVPGRPNPTATPVAVSIPPRKTTASTPTAAYRVDADVPSPVTGPAHLPPIPARRSGHSAYDDAPVNQPLRLPLWVTLLSCVLVALATGGIGFWVGRTTATPDAPDEKPSRLANLNANQETSPTKSHEPVVPESANRNPPETSHRPADVNKAAPQTTASQAKKSAGNPRHSVEPETAPKVEPQVSPQMQETQTTSNGPPQVEKTTPTNNGAPSPVPDALELPEPNANDPDQQEKLIAQGIPEPVINIFGGTRLLGPGRNFYVQKEENNLWKILISNENTKSELATMRYDTESKGLFFRWHSSAAGAAQAESDILKRCMIRLEEMGPLRSMSKKAEFAGPSLIVQRAPSTISFEQVLAKSLRRGISIGKWRMNSLKGFFTESPHAQFNDKKEATAVKISSERNREIASINVKWAKGVSDDQGDTLTYEFVAQVPQEKGKPEGISWTVARQNSKTERFSKKRIEEEVSGLKKHEDRMMAEVKMIDDQEKAAKERYEAMNMILPEKEANEFESKRAVAKTKYADREKDIMGLKEWREEIDTITSQLRQSATFSFDIWYECDVDGKPVEVIVGTVTSGLPKSTEDSSPEASP